MPTDESRRAAFSCTTDQFGPLDLRAFERERQPRPSPFWPVIQSAGAVPGLHFGRK